MGNLAMDLLSIGQFYEKNGLLVTVCFGSTAACRYFITWAAGFGQKQSYRQQPNLTSP